MRALVNEVLVELVDVQEGCRVSEAVPKQQTHQAGIGDAVTLHEVLVEEQVHILLENARTQHLVGQDHLRQTTAPEIVLESRRHPALGGAGVGLVLQPPKAQELLEGEGEYLIGGRFDREARWRCHETGGARRSR